MNIISLQPCDIEHYFNELVDLKLRSMEHSFPKGTNGLREVCQQKVLEIPDYIAQQKAVVIGAVEEPENLVGFLWAYPRTFLNEKRLFINGIAVVEKFEGTGLGKRMLKQLEEIGRTQGYSAIDLMVAPFNQHAVKFYKRAGFEDERIQMVLQLR